MKKGQIWGIIALTLLTILFILVGSVYYLSGVNTYVSSRPLLIVIAGGGILMIAEFMLLIYLCGRNIQEQKRAARYQEQVFRVLAANTDDVFLLLATDSYKVEYVSPNVERILGIPAAEVMEDVEALELMEEREGRHVNDRELRTIEPGTSRTLEGPRIHRKTGEERWFLETVYRTTINDTDKFVIQISDRTAERQSKEILEEALDIAKAANESKSALLSNMSHDIRTPLNAIVGLCTLLQRDADNPKRMESHVRKISASSQHLLGLLNDVLDMGKIESGRTSLNISDFLLGELVEEVETMIRSQARAKGQEFLVSAVDVKTECFQGDKLRIRRVLTNILGDVVKDTPEGGRICFTVRQMPQKKKDFVNLQFVIEDNGAPDRMQGLGMAITESLVDIMGGSIQVESEPGKGSVFTVNLELRASEQNADRKFWKKYGIAEALVAADDAETGGGIVHALNSVGVAAHLASGGREAVLMVQEAYADGRAFDLMLLDDRMPDMDGLETALNIRNNLAGSDPMILLMSYDWEQVEKEARLKGIDGFLPKPFFLSNLRQTVENVKSRSGDELGQRGVTSALEGLHFLMAEDNDLNAQILVEILSMVGAACDVASNGKKVLEAFEQSEPGQYDMILMDVQMPVMDGYKAAKAIRASAHPSAGSIPIIAVTANAFAEDIQAAKDAGMDAHIAKPVILDQLEIVVRDVSKKAAQGAIDFSSQK